MSSGFFTKHYIDSERCFYYNAERGLSVWTPPIDCVVHEAPNARNDLLGASPAMVSTVETAIEEGELDNTSAAIESASTVMSSTEALQYIPVEGIEVPKESSLRGGGMVGTVDELLSAIKQQTAPKIGNKRFRHVNAEGAEAPQIQSEYSKLVSAYKTASGAEDKEDEGGKWLVR